MLARGLHGRCPSPGESRERPTEALRRRRPKGQSKLFERQKPHGGPPDQRWSEERSSRTDAARRRAVGSPEPRDTVTCPAETDAGGGGSLGGDRSPWKDSVSTDDRKRSNGDAGRCTEQGLEVAARGGRPPLERRRGGKGRGDAVRLTHLLSGRACERVLRGSFEGCERSRGAAPRPALGHRAIGGRPGEEREKRDQPRDRDHLQDGGARTREPSRG